MPEEIIWRRRGLVMVGEVRRVPKIIPAEFSRDERLALHAAYLRGERSERVLAGHREYARLQKRAQRQAIAKRNRRAS